MMSCAVWRQQVVCASVTTVIFSIILFNAIVRLPNSQRWTVTNVLRDSRASPVRRFTSNYLWRTNASSLDPNRTLESTIECVGSLNNQSCLYRNLYYVDRSFTILTVKDRQLPAYSVISNAFALWPTTPDKREFDSYSELEKFVRGTIDPTVLPGVTLYFGQFWHHNVGHALFDGLYPGYVALIRFSPRHLHPFRILAKLNDCTDCWTEEIYSRFAGLGLLKQSILDQWSRARWFMFDELVMGSGTLCQRCTQANLQLAGGVELDASRLFRDRMYRQHGLVGPVQRQKHSAQGRNPRELVYAYVVDNKRYTPDDRNEIDSAIRQLNDDTDEELRRMTNKTNPLQRPLVRVYSIYYEQIRGLNRNWFRTNATTDPSKSLHYDLNENKFIAHLKTMRKVDIHVAGPGTGQMYQTFLPDGSVHINLGGLRPIEKQYSKEAYASFLEQHMTSGTPYIKGLYYPINERPEGIKKNQVVRLILEAAQLILQGFSFPVDPQENLATDGQLFIEMCEKDPKFCSMVTYRSLQTHILCLDIWVEDFVHEQKQWSVNGSKVDHEIVTCPFNRTLLHQLRDKYRIRHLPRS